MKNRKIRKSIIVILMCLIAFAVFAAPPFIGRSNEPNLSAEFTFAGKNERLCFPSCTTLMFKRYFFATSLNEQEIVRFFEKLAKRRTYDDYDSIQRTAEYQYKQLHFVTQSGGSFDVEYYDSANAAIAQRNVGLKLAEGQNLIGLVQDDYPLVRNLISGK